MAQIHCRLSYVRFYKPEFAHQIGETVTEVRASDGWLMSDDVDGWVAIRRYQNHQWLDTGALWVPDSNIAERRRAQYPEGTVLNSKRPDHLYPEDYPDPLS